MKDILFTFEEEKIPFPVVFATAALIVIFVLGLLYRGAAALFF